MRATPDLVGRQFGRLTVIANTGRQRSDNREWLWRCKCICGNEVIRNVSQLKRIQSCGCLRSEVGKTKVIEIRKPPTHRHTVGRQKSPEYSSWASMIQRCLNPNHKKYKDYGGRGIGVCERYKSFENFLADLGPRPPRMTLHRIDNEKGYEPGNCKWATRKEQQQKENRRPMTFPADWYDTHPRNPYTGRFTRKPST